MTEEEAATKYCPVSFAGDNAGRCQGQACMAWRWESLKADDAFAAAIKRASDELGDKSPSRSKAVKHVLANREAYGLPTKPVSGYCGLAGRIEA